jgi:hypothetical protein
MLKFVNGWRDGGSNVCQTSPAFKSLKKEANIYDDWVYMGKETYGSKHTTSRSLKSGTKFFDALGRVYEEMKIRLAYYIFKDAVQKNERDITLEFEVWARIIKDSEGNDIQAFIKEDKARGLRRDSSFYWNGYWEVMTLLPSMAHAIHGKKRKTHTDCCKKQRAVKSITNYTVPVKLG